MKTTRSYIKAARHDDHRVVDQTFHFFEETDRASIDAACREANASAAAIGGTLSIWRMPEGRGLWSTVPVIGDSYHGERRSLRLVDQPFGRDVN